MWKVFVDFVFESRCIGYELIFEVVVENIEIVLDIYIKIVILWDLIRGRNILGMYLY